MSLILKSLTRKRGIRRYIGPKRIGLIMVFVAFIFFAWNFYRDGSISPEMIERYSNNHPIGTVILFILIYAISVVASLPSLPLNLAGGFFWGGLLGGFYSTLGVTIGGWFSFAATRWLFGQPLAEKFNNKWASKVQEAFDKGGWKFVAFARINPIIPTGPLNYLLGLTSLSNTGFLWATFVFLLPLSIAIAFIGDTLQTFTVQQSSFYGIVKGALVVSAALTFLVAAKFVSKILNKRTDG